MNENQTDSWIPIENSTQWHQLAESCDYFEDGVVRELSWTGGEYVDANRQMNFKGLPFVWLLIQTQNASAPAIEFLVMDAVEIRLDHSFAPEFNMVFGANGILFELSPSGAGFIRGAQLFYRMPERQSLGETGLLTGHE